MTTFLRFTRKDPCPICGGYDGMVRHKGIRCFGGRDGDYVYCTRKEHAGGAPYSEGAKAWRHRLTGDCKCGKEHGWAPTPIPFTLRQSRVTQPTEERKSADHWRPDVTYDYVSAGKQPFQVCRTKTATGKTFAQRQPRDGGGWWAGLDGIEPFIYNRDAVLAAPYGALIIFNEGEKAAEACIARGLLATSSPMGAGCFREAYAEDFRGKRVIISADHDEAGRKHAADVAAKLQGIALSVWIVEFTDLPEKADAYDFFEGGGTAEDFYRRALCAPLVSTAAPPVEPDLTEHLAAKDALIASLEVDLAAAERELKSLRAVERGADRETHWGAVVDTIEAVCTSPDIKQEAKPPFIRLLIAKEKHERGFGSAADRPVPLWQDQFAEMMGGADAKTVKHWFECIGAANLATVVKEKTGKFITMPKGGRKEVERYAIQIGPRAGEAPLDLATYRSLMCNPSGPARRQPRKEYERRCPDHPTAMLHREDRCTVCKKLVYEADVAPTPTNERDGKLSRVIGELPPAMTREIFPAYTSSTGAEDFPRHSTTLCPCGTPLARGESCPRCDDRACRACGELTGDSLRSFCVGRCRTLPLTNTPPTRAEVLAGQREYAADLAAVGGGD